MIQIFATSKYDDRMEIKDMYWFEENGVHDIHDGEGHYYKYFFEIYVDGKLVFCNFSVNPDDAALYEIAMNRIHDIFDAAPGSQEEDELIKLVEWAEKYEEKHFPID